MAQADVVVVGHICLDVIPTFLEQKGTRIDEVLVPGKLVDVGAPVVSTGGPVSNTGLALHKLGLSTSLMGKVGDDLFGGAIMDVIRGVSPELARGMIVSPGDASSYTVVINPPGIDRIFLHCPGANDTFASDDVPYDTLPGTRLFHFGYPPLMQRMYSDGGRELETIFSRVKQQGLTTSLDMAKPDPASEAGRVDWPEILSRVLPHVDVFLPSADEILFMLDRDRFMEIERTASSGDVTSWADGDMLVDIADQLLAMGPAIVGLKLGEQGFLLRSSDDETRLANLGAVKLNDLSAWVGRKLIAPCFDVQVVGTTGSGDATIAGCLAGLLHGMGPDEVVTGAVAVGACNVESADALGGIRPWSKVQKRIADGWPRRELTLGLPGWSFDETKHLYRG